MSGQTVYTWLGVLTMSVKSEFLSETGVLSVCITYRLEERGVYGPHPEQ